MRRNVSKTIVYNSMPNPIDSIINPSFVERGTFSISPDKSFKYPQNGLEFSNEFFINVGKISLQNVLGPLSRTFEATAHEEIVVSQCCLRFTDQVFHRKKMGISIFSISYYDMKFKLALEKPLDAINLIT